MTLLCTDTSTAGKLLLALSHPQGMLTRTLDIEGLEEVFIPQIQNLLNEASLGLDQIGGFVIGSGPGSFMGLRLGYAAFKAWAWALKRPLGEASSLEVFARSHLGASAPSIDGKMGKVFCAVFDEGQRLEEDADLTPASYQALLEKYPLARPLGFLGSGETASAEGLLKAALALPSEAFLSGKALLAAQPRYLRLSAAEEALQKKTKHNE